METPIELVRRFCAAWSAGASVHDLAAFFTEEAAYHNIPLEPVTGKDAIPLGKPYTFFFNCIKKIHPDIDPKRTLMIGDRLTTDMVFGRNNGLKTLFVQSGIGTFEEMSNYRNSKDVATLMCVPDLYLQSLADLRKYLKIAD